MPGNILETLFSGDITPNERYYTQSPAYKDAQQSYERNRSKLAKQLEAELKEAFDKLCETQVEMGYLNNCNHSSTASVSACRLPLPGSV